MHKKLTFIVLSLLCIVAFAALAFAQVTPDNAKASVKKAAEFFKANGKGKALVEFSNPQGQFCQDDLYIYVIDLNGKMLAHPKADLVGKDFTHMKDAEGKTFAVDMIKLAKEKGNGWVDYRLENLKTKVVEDKTAYFEKVDDVIIAACTQSGFLDTNCD
jgi:cytochrome c